MPPSDSTALDDRRRPTLLNSCARATTVEEARFRLTYPRATQTTCVIALDGGAERLLASVADHDWNGAPRFLVYERPDRPGGSGRPLDARLRATDGRSTRLSVELDDAETVVMIATTDDAAEAADIVGDECAERRITTTGLVMADWDDLASTVSSLRPNAMVLVISHDADDLASMLTALRV